MFKGSRRPEGGLIRDIAFKNVSVLGGPVRKSYLKGLDAKHLLENVTFENLRIHGRTITDAGAARIETNEFVRGLRFI